MKINASADEEFTNAVVYVLNKIKRSLLFDSESRQIADYRFDLNSKWRAGPGFLEEKAVLQKLRNENIISDIGETDIFEVGMGTPEYAAHETYHFKISEEFNEYYDRYQKIQNVTQNYCWFDNNTFSLTLQDGSVKAISFDTERSSRQMLALFQTIVEHWKKNGDKPIAGSEIVKAMVRYGSRVDSIQLKNIISNVRNKKIKPAGLENKIHIEHDRKAGGWRIDIKR